MAGVFFALSKICWALAEPLALVALLTGAGLLGSFTRFRRLSRLFAGTGLIILVMSGWTSLGAVLLHPLENRFRRPDPAPSAVAGIVVLGGGLEGAINLARGGYELNRGGDRFVEAAILARRYPDARIVLSGGAGSLLLDGEPDADAGMRLLVALGVESHRIIREDRSRNTDENARFSREAARQLEGETWLLVTSAFHMPRSVGLFRKADFAVVPWPTDYRTTGNEGFGLFRDNVVDSVHNTGTAMREWIGLAVYRVTGRTDTLLPAP